MKNKSTLISAICSVSFIAINMIILIAIVLQPAPTKIVVPSKRQLAWHKNEQCAFVHFGMNTFTNQDWGYGDDDPSKFNPTAKIDAEQWVKTIKNAGLKMLILTCKHHDGFCLWPSKYTDYSVKASPYEGGNADIVKEVSDACHNEGIKFGVYLSPWDRHHADYGLPDPAGSRYLEYYRNQLTELLTNYGVISEVWFDGAEGGEGWYGGSDDVRFVDQETYYEWDKIYSLVRELQPTAVMAQGLDLRWCGNEDNCMGDTNWNTYFTPYPKAYGSDFETLSSLNSGFENEKYWLPAEVNARISNGWFWNSDADSVKDADTLFNIYLRSVGRGAGLLLNCPPGQDGKLPDSIVASLNGWRQKIDQTFSNKIGSSFNSKVVTLTNKQSAKWIVLQENISKGQRIGSFKVEGLVNGKWKTLEFEDGCWDNIKETWTPMHNMNRFTTIGNKRILLLNNSIVVNKIRINISRSIYKDPQISCIEVFN